MRNLLRDAGPINAILEKIGLVSAANPLPFLSDPLWAKFSIIIVNMWVGIPVTMLVATGIIMNLPQEQIEAAEIDGASKFQIFKSITFPQILLVMMPNLIQQFIGNINNFNVIYLLTGGGPTNSNFYQAGSTDLLVYMALQFDSYCSRLQPCFCYRYHHLCSFCRVQSSSLHKNKFL